MHSNWKHKFNILDPRVFYALKIYFKNILLLKIYFFTKEFFNNMIKHINFKKKNTIYLSNSITKIK